MNIDSIGEAIWGGYNQGRATHVSKISQNVVAAQWSAVMDNKTCDWCGWADERIFDPRIEPWDAPVHFGCRCIVAYIYETEFPGDITWGKGPPKSSFPPGSKGGYADGKPTLRNEPSKSKSALQPKGKKAKLDKVVNEHRKLGEFGDDGRPYATGKFKDWHRAAIKEISEVDGDAFKVAYRHLDEAIKSWSRSSDPNTAKMLENLLAGQLDEAMKVMRESGLTWQRTALADIAQGFATMDDLARVWQAQQEITQAVYARKVNKVINLYRGMAPQGPGTQLEAVIDSIVAGDLEQSIGTKFIESWSSRVQVAENFSGRGGAVFKKAVEVDDLILTYDTTPGLLGHAQEREVLWSNWDGTIVPKSAVRRPSPSRMSSRKMVADIEVW